VVAVPAGAAAAREHAAPLSAWEDGERAHHLIDDLSTINLPAEGRARMRRRDHKERALDCATQSAPMLAGCHVRGGEEGNADDRAPSMPT
jgi:hypothetical protein